jgi:dissimilatory sulfite reductase (desulfoviridin) alpha/beta subunit
MTDHLPAHTVKVCRGATLCPHAVLGQDLSFELETVLTASGWPRFLAEMNRPIRHHHQFRVAVASCPNGCSQPHIADFGLIAFARIGLEPERCSSCGHCVAVCAEKALHLNDTIRLDQSRCLGCAKCARVCPEKALRTGETGYRVLLGGKLGRHPRLAHELGFFSLPDSLHVLSRVLNVYMNHHRPGLRLGDLIESMGRKNFDSLVRP